MLSNGLLRHRGYIFLLLLSSVLAASSTMRGERLPIRLYTTAEFLWSSSISYLMRCSHGFIGFCERDRLSRGEYGWRRTAQEWLCFWVTVKANPQRSSKTF